VDRVWSDLGTDHTETIDVVTNGDERMDQQALAEQLLADAKANNVELIGPAGC
jgi:RNA-binding protein YhbY